MVRISPLSRRAEPARTQAQVSVPPLDDEDRDARVGKPGHPAMGSPGESGTTIVKSSGDGQATYQSQNAPTRPIPDHLERTADMAEPELVVSPGFRPRASLLATLSLIVGVSAAMFVLTGTLAGYGILLGVFALVFSVFGLAATRQRHVAGKADALIGMLLGMAAMVAGLVALTGTYSWPNMDADTVERFRQWLDSQFAGRF